MSSASSLPLGGTGRYLSPLSRLLSLGCLVAVVAMPFLVVGMWALDAPAELYASMVPKPEPHALPPQLDGWQRLVGAGLALIPAAFSMVALVRVRRCFDSFAAGLYFEAGVVAGLRGFAGMTALSCGIGFLLQPVFSGLLSLHNPVGQRFISVGVSSEQIRSLFFAGMVWIIAAVMAKAVALAQENSEFV